ncbi:hypothetical protein Droror1_Dr00011383 [Drosera rotundifolia]
MFAGMATGTFWLASIFFEGFRLSSSFMCYTMVYEKAPPYRKCSCFSLVFCLEGKLDYLVNIVLTMSWICIFVNGHHVVSLTFVIQLVLDRDIISEYLNADEDVWYNVLQLFDLYDANFMSPVNRGQV